MSDACGLLNAMQMASGYGPEDARQVQLHWRCHQLGALRRPIGWHYTGWQRRPLSPSLARGLWLCGGRQRRPLSPSFARGTWTPPSSTKVLPPPQAVYLAAHAFCIGITTLPLLLHALPLLLHACLSFHMPCHSELLSGTSRAHLLGVRASTPNHRALLLCRRRSPSELARGRVSRRSYAPDEGAVR